MEKVFDFLWLYRTPMSQGGHRREVRKTHLIQYCAEVGRLKFKRPTLGALASSIVGNEFEVLPFPKFAPNKFDGKFRKGEVFGLCGIGHSAPVTACQGSPCVKGAVSVAN